MGFLRSVNGLANSLNQKEILGTFALQAGSQGLQEHVEGSLGNGALYYQNLVASLSRVSWLSWSWGHTRTHSVWRLIVCVEKSVYTHFEQPEQLSSRTLVGIELWLQRRRETGVGLRLGHPSVLLAKLKGLPLLHHWITCNYIYTGSEDKGITPVTTTGQSLSWF